MDPEELKRLAEEHGGRPVDGQGLDWDSVEPTDPSEYGLEAPSGGGTLPPEELEALAESARSGEGMGPTEPPGRTDAERGRTATVDDLGMLNQFLIGFSDNAMPGNSYRRMAEKSQGAGDYMSDNMPLVDAAAGIAIPGYDQLTGDAFAINRMPGDIDERMAAVEDTIPGLVGGIAGGIGGIAAQARTGGQGLGWGVGTGAASGAIAGASEEDSTAFDTIGSGLLGGALGGAGYGLGNLLRPAAKKGMQAWDDIGLIDSSADTVTPGQLEAMRGAVQNVNDTIPGMGVKDVARGAYDVALAAYRGAHGNVPGLAFSAFRGAYNLGRGGLNAVRSGAANATEYGAQALSRVSPDALPYAADLLGVERAHAQPPPLPEPDGAVNAPQANLSGTAERNQSIERDPSAAQSTPGDEWIVPNVLTNYADQIDPKVSQSLQKAYASGDEQQVSAAIYSAVQRDPNFARIREALLEENDE